MKVLRRNLSLMLAARYLNPLRSLFSIITLICLGGVALGVMVLIVVLSVMEGLQGEMEKRVLAFTPHLNVQRLDVNGEIALTSAENFDWPSAVENIQKIPGVVAAYPKLSTNTFIQNDNGRHMGRFQAIEPHNKGQLDPLLPMLREGSFDFGEGLNEECVVSFTLAQGLGLKLGDTVTITPIAGNYQEVFDIYNLIQTPLLTHENAQFMQDIAAYPTQSGAEAAATESRLATAIEQFNYTKMRPGEIEACDEFVAMLTTRDSAVGLSESQKEIWKKCATQLATLNIDTENGKIARSISDVVMPTDLKIIGIYQTPRNSPGPDVFLPLEIAQNALGFSHDGHNYIHGISVRVQDAHRSTDVVGAIFTQLPPDDSNSSWQIVPWTKQLGQWFDLIANERAMMTFVLSIITVIAAFCIMAVMFTISMQRKREIAVMQALGATPWSIMRIFLWQGLIIGFVGALLGVGLALLVLHYRLDIQAALAAMGLDPFPMDAQGITLPAAYNFATFAKQALTAFVMVTIAAVVPAFVVSRQDPARALRSN